MIIMASKQLGVDQEVQIPSIFRLVKCADEYDLRDLITKDAGIVD